MLFVKAVGLDWIQIVEYNGLHSDIVYSVPVTTFTNLLFGFRSLRESEGERQIIGRERHGGEWKRIPLEMGKVERAWRGWEVGRGSPLFCNFFILFLFFFFGILKKEGWEVVFFNRYPYL